MGQVFAAIDTATRAEVAIKVVSRTLADDVLMLRLHREAEAAQRVRSDFVPNVLEVSETEEGETFLVMERLVGEPLSQRIRDNGALPWAEVCRVGEDILRALIDAHTAGVVHRDLKPSNVFLARKDAGVRAMVLDFGVCKIDAIGAERLTGTGESIGTVAYMAPEQIRGAARVDERADLYAFGALVFEMLSGRLPHEGTSQMAILASKLENTAARLRDCARVAIPDGADDIVGRALQRDPEQRFANAQELLKAWRALPGVERNGAIVVRGSQSEESLGGEGPPTEITRPSSTRVPVSINSAPTMQGGEEPPTYVPPAASRRGMPPLESHGTQTSLTAHTGVPPRKAGTARVAVLLAALGLVAGIVVVFVSFTLGPRKHASAGAAPTTSAPLEAPTAAVEITASSASAAASAGEPPEMTETLELPPDPAPSASAPRPRRPHAPPKSSGPRITTQPRY